MNEFSSVSSANSNISSSSPIYDYSPASTSSNDNQSDSNTIILYTEKCKSSNEIILNINDIGMERLKNKIKSNANNESCIELEAEFDSDEDVVRYYLIFQLIS